MRFLQFFYVTSKRERNNCSRLLKQPSNHWTPSDIQDVGKRFRDRQIKCSEEAWRTGIGNFSSKISKHAAENFGAKQSHVL